MITRRGLGALAAALLVAPRRAVADTDSDSHEQAMVEAAKTPADHAALATHFREEASKARSRSQHHELMAKAYSGKQGFTAARPHCLRLAKTYEEAAVEYERLAELHDAEAKKAQ